MPFVPKSWDGENILAQLHYPLWQLSLYFAAKKLHRRINFDIAHHVTWGRYWSPSLLSMLRIPFVWGPIGGGESTPNQFISGLTVRGAFLEYCRNIVRKFGECDPFVRATARRCATALATTPETAARLTRLHTRRVILKGHAALDRAQAEQLASISAPPEGPLCFISMGRLLHWKGFHLSLKAFAEASIDNARYTLVGDGAQRKTLESLARRLGISDRVTFTGQLPRHQALAMLESSHVLLHPSFHDSGGWVCIEAMAAGRPVICLDLGGPATLVNPKTGLKIPALTPMQAISDMAKAMRQFAINRQLAAAMGTAARESVFKSFLWEHIAGAVEQVYRELKTGTAL
jgi:glycosyltransferase involved in cell wall biosynthesis